MVFLGYGFFFTFVMDVEKMFNLVINKLKLICFFSSFCSVLQAYCLVESYI